jgi:hypothetical protein
VKRLEDFKGKEDATFDFKCSIVEKAPLKKIIPKKPKGNVYEKFLRPYTKSRWITGQNL